nr:ABC transporter substrate-binding protein [Arthrobacter zhangbolii]
MGKRVKHPLAHQLRTTAVLGTAALLLATAACGSPGEEDPAAGQSAAEPTSPVTLTWQAAPFGNRADDARVWLVEEFEAEHPNIDIEVISAPTNVDTNRASLATQIMGGASTPDIYNGDVAWAAQLADNGLALPVDRYLPEDYFDGFDPAVVEGATFEDQVFGIPLTLDQSFLYYRKDLLEKHGLPVPGTWQEVAEQARTLQDAGEVAEGITWQGASYEGLTAVTNEFVASAGGSLVNEDLSEGLIDSPEATEAVEFMRDLVADGTSPRGVPTYQEPQSLQTFTNGDAAFMRNWAYAYATAENEETSGIAGKVGVTSMPAFGDGDTNAASVGGWNVYVNPHTEQLGASLTFLKWLTSAETQTDLAKRSSTIPTLDAVREAADVQVLSPVIVASAGNDLVARPTASPYYPQISQSIYGQVNGILAGTTETGAGLEAARNGIRSALEGRSL